MKKKIIFFFVVISCLLTIKALVVYLITPNNTLSYFNQSFLINYSNGFVRRGLLGEVFKFIHLKTGTNILSLIKYFSLICYTIVFVYIIKLFLKEKIPIYFLLLPYILPYYLLIGFIGSRDFFLLILFVSSIHAVKKVKNKVVLYFILNMISIIGILSHEIYFFCSLPLILLFLISKSTNSFVRVSIYNIFSQLLCFLPVFIVLLLVTVYSGSESTFSMKMYQDILKIVPSDATGICNTGLSGEPQNQIPYMFKGLIYNGFSRGVSYSIFLVMIFFIFLFFNHLTENKIDPDFITTLFLIQLISFIPIFIIAIDWQRWFSMAIYTSIIAVVEMKSTHYFKIGCLNKCFIFLRRQISKIINTNKESVWFLAVFCIIPYYELGNTPYQFSNMFLIIMNYLTKGTSFIF